MASERPDRVELSGSSPAADRLRVYPEQSGHLRRGEQALVGSVGRTLVHPGCWHRFHESNVRVRPGGVDGPCTPFVRLREPPVVTRSRGQSQTTEGSGKVAGLWT